MSSLAAIIMYGEYGVSLLVELVLDAGDDDISGFEGFLPIEVLRFSVKSPSHSQNRMGAFLLRGSAGSPT